MVSFDTQIFQNLEPDHVYKKRFVLHKTGGEATALERKSQCLWLEKAHMYIRAGRIGPVCHFSTPGAGVACCHEKDASRVEETAQLSEQIKRASYVLNHFHTGNEVPFSFLCEFLQCINIQQKGAVRGHVRFIAPNGLALLAAICDKTAVAATIVEPHTHTLSLSLSLLQLDVEHHKGQPELAIHSVVWFAPHFDIQTGTALMGLLRCRRNSLLNKYFHSLCGGALQR